VYRVTEPGYFQTMALPLLPGGRDFTVRDTLETAPVAIVNQAFASSIFPQSSPIGKRITLSEPGDSPIVWRTIVGVVANARQQDWRGAPEPEIYLPFRQSQDYLQSAAPHFATMTLVVHTQGSPASLTESVRQAVWSVDRTASISHITTLEAEKDRQLWRPRFAMWIATGFGTLALILASLGIYAVVAYAASLRAREMGIRMAIGASKQSVAAIIIGQGVRLVGWGVLIGLVASLALGRVLESVLYQVSARDSLTYGASALLFVAVAVAASYLPARRAARTDPAVILRGD
jgi:predicted permease